MTYINFLQVESLLLVSVTGKQVPCLHLNPWYFFIPLLFPCPLRRGVWMRSWVGIWLLAKLSPPQRRHDYLFEYDVTVKQGRFLWISQRNQSIWCKAGLRFVMYSVCWRCRTYVKLWVCSTSCKRKEQHWSLQNRRLLLLCQKIQYWIGRCCLQKKEEKLQPWKNKSIKLHWISQKTTDWWKECRAVNEVICINQLKKLFYIIGFVECELQFWLLLAVL